MVHIEVDSERCIGSGACVFAAPNVFDQRDEDGIVILLEVNPGDAEERNVENAAMSCPASVIRLRR